ncbi:MAG: isoleucine--tRNA ligase [Thermoplasmata archaeon]|nr:MAG: isoleucine--tRNA ligase [Thermoplasmata archaeon]
MIHQAEKKYQPNEMEKYIQELWIKSKAYEKTKEQCKTGKEYYFIDGPPYTTGYIHLGTAWNKILKDVVLRYRRMQKYNVRDQAGFDMHGLPIEVLVEKSMGIKDKRQIEEMGIDTFVDKCREFAQDFKVKMVDQFKKLGIWLDWENPYLTIKNNYIESEWWTLSKAHDKGLLIQSERVLTWCPRCQTALAEAEVEYWDETDPSIYVRFPLKGKDNESILIWTTTPWTLLANLAIAVNPEFIYAKVKLNMKGKEEIMYLFEERVEDVMALIGCRDFEVLDLLGGSQLAELEYMHPFLREMKYHQNLEGEWIHKVLLSDTVTEEYTGVVHIAPGHGPEDFEIGKEFDIPPFCPVTEDGRFSEETGRYAGIDIKKGNDYIIAELKRKGLMLFDDEVTHRYGHCWRCKIPIIYRATDQWFLKVTEIKDDMLEEIADIPWYPDWAGSSRMHDWVSNARDWCISRQRYWGTPLPIWKCECGNIRVIGSIDDLSEGDNYKGDLDLHRPWIDAITFPCPDCNNTMKRVPDVMDVWFDSAVCAWAQLGFPGDKKEFQKWWPCKWITEAHDQTRGWFYSQLGAGVIAFDEIPYKSVLMHGWALDDAGKRMSKSSGNIVEPFDIIKDYGVDSLRFYLLKTSAPWDDLSFSEEGVKNAKRTLNILWNVYVFSTTYMSIDKFEPDKASFRSIRKYMRIEDKWLLSKAESLKKDVIAAMNNYDVHVACRKLEEFILEDLSRWYVRLVRDRTWVESEEPDKLAVYKVLHEVLMTVFNLMAPLTPHFAEEAYQNLDGKLPTIFMSPVVKYDKALVDSELNRQMDIAREIVERVASARQKAKIKLRWPVKLVVVKAGSPEVEDAVEALESVILRQTNAKALEIVRMGEQWGGMELEVKPNMEVIGPVFRQWASKIAALLQYQSARRIKEGIEKGEYSLGIEGQQVRIMPNMVSFMETLPKGVLQEEFSDGFIFLDTEITDEIRSEGFAKEMIRRIQEMRKEMNLHVEEEIHTKIKISDELYDILEGKKDYITRETRSQNLDFVTDELSEGYIVEWNAEGESFTISIVTERAIAEMEARKKAKELPVNLCEFCGNVLNYIEEYKRWYCYSCKKYASEEREEVPVEEKVMEGQPQFCPLCGAQLPENAIVCSRCGAPLLEELPEEVLPEEPVYEEPISEEAVAEEPVEAEEEEEEAMDIEKLKWGGTHLIKSETTDEHYKLIEQAVEKGHSAICFTRDFPKKLKDEFNFGETKVYWLSNIGKKDTIRPKNLEKLSLSMEQFLSRDENGVILLSGIEYLITNNNFITVLRLIQSMRDQVAVANSILIIPVNPSILEGSQLKLLEREVDVIL